MKKKFIIPLLLLFSLSLFSQNKTSEKRTGLSFLAVPTLSFDSDLGLEYGAFARLLNYGDGSRFPMYDYALSLEYARQTKGGQKFRFTFDSDRLIKNIQTNLDIVYVEDLLAHFFGFNGYNAVFIPEMEQLNRAFYRYQNKTFRVGKRVIFNPICLRSHV